MRKLAAPLLLLVCSCTGIIDGPSGSSAGGGTVPGAQPSGGPGEKIPEGREPRLEDPRPWYDLGTERHSAGLRLLTPTELARAVADLTGVAPNVADLPEPLLARGLDNQTSELRVRDVLHMKHLLVLATDVASRANIETIIACQNPAAGCTASEIGAFISAAVHGSVSAPTLNQHFARYQQVWTAEGDELLARRAVLQALLFSPDFLYRSELGIGRSDGLLGSIELASKLAFFLWGTRPDAELRALGQSGALLDPATFVEQVDRLGRDPRAEGQLLRLLGGWLGFGHFDLSLKADAANLPAGLQQDMLREVELLVHDLFTAPAVEEQSLRHLLGSRETWMNGAIAGLYGSMAATGTEFVKVSLDGIAGRRGILTTPLVLAAHAKELGRSPMQRGRFLINEVSCFEFAPEAGDPVMLLKDESAINMRESFKPLELNGGCSYCHQALNAGFAFDVFDNIGRRYPSNIVTDAETYGFFDLRPYPRLEFTGPTELVDGLSSHEAVAKCVVVQAFRLAQGRMPGLNDAASFTAIETAFADGQGSLPALMKDIARSPSFRAR
jgi:hypothetical protein